jgi:hypothetical protein
MIEAAMKAIVHLPSVGGKCEGAATGREAQLGFGRS